MLTEIPYKFKYMLNKIINCIIEFIMKNFKNDLLLESKLILINNYILEVFHTTEISGNINTKLNKSIYNVKNIILEISLQGMKKILVYRSLIIFS